MKREEKIKKLLNRRYFSCPPLDSDYQKIEFYEPKSRFASTEPLVLVEENEDEARKKAKNKKKNEKRKIKRPWR